MLRSIMIQNYALIDSLEVRFENGLNIITGETGAGKSLILGALSLALGEKGSSRIMRDENKQCIIELEFRLEGNDIKNVFAQNEVEYDEETIIRRVISPNGRIRNFINDVPVTVSDLKAIGAELIDIHSQHQTLLLQNPEFRRSVVDTIAGNSGLLEKYGKLYSELRKAEKNLEKFEENLKNSEREFEFLKYQYEELKNLNLKESEYDELEKNISILSNASEIKEALINSDTLLSNDEAGILTFLKQIDTILSRIQEFFPSAKELSERIKSTRYELKDISQELFTLEESVDSDPEKLEKSIQRLDVLNSLIQKYKVSGINELIELKQNLEKKLALTLEPEEEIIRLKGIISGLNTSCNSLAEQISRNRKKAAEVTGNYVVTTASGLGMPNIRFHVAVEKTEGLTSTGYDNVRYLFTSNKNIPAGDVEKIASGGEMSRIMLCIKSIVAKHRKLPTVIFDEIDTGISGETADKMGEIIENLAGYMQVLNITHLPQVASKGEAHFSVYKEDSENATNTCIKKLSKDERVLEIAKMLSGSDITNTAVEQAKTLLHK